MKVVLGYDGSLAANAAIRSGAALFPAADAVVVYLCTPPFGSKGLRARLRHSARNVDELIDLVDRESDGEAARLVDTGVTLARAAGWNPEPLVKRTWAGEGLGLAQVAEQLGPDVLIVGARGLGASDSKLGGVSDLVVHHAARAVLVVSQNMISAEYDALADGPVVVGVDGSAGAERALSAAHPCSRPARWSLSGWMTAVRSTLPQTSRHIACRGSAGPVPVPPLMRWSPSPKINGPGLWWWARAAGRR